MTEFWAFAGHHPITAILLACCAATVLVAPFKYSFMAFNRAMRARNIAARGWPTAPLDADGDVVWPKEDQQ